MKILSLKADGVSSVKAVRVNGKGYFNIKHGSFGEGLYKYSMGIDSNVTAEVKGNTLDLDGNNYNLIPVMKAGEVKKDSNNNTLYFVVEDEGSHTDNECILFWSLPLVKGVTVNYIMDGNVVEIGKGMRGKVRADCTISSTCPVLEVTGDCSLTWSYQIDNLVLTNTTVFKNGKWITTPTSETKQAIV